MTRLSRLVLPATALLVFAPSAPAREVILPKPLQPGDTIMMVAPAGALDRERVGTAAERLRAMGFRVIVPDDLFRRRGYLAGTDRQRADELMRAFTDPEIDAVFPGTGGYGTTRILELLDYDQIAANPKMLIGFSDITGLHVAIGQRCNLATVHSPNPMWGLGSPDGMPVFAADHFWPMVRPDAPLRIPYTYPVSDEFGPPTVYAEGAAEGRLVGGNLSLVAAMVGTPFEAETDGKVLFLEDVREAPYRVDRMLRQLKSAGLLDSPAAVILGQFHRCQREDHEDDDDTPGLSLDRVFRDYFEGAPYPVVGNFPAGHVPDHASLPMRCRYRVDGGKVTLLELPYEPPQAVETAWAAAYQGVELKSLRLTEPRPLWVRAARIDLSAPGVSVRTNPSNGDRPEETDGMKTSSFLKEFGCQLAINGAPFWPVVPLEGLPHNVVGVVVSGGELVSPVDSAKPRPALVFRARRASIETPPINLGRIQTAVGGFSVVLRGGAVVDDGSASIHPRTAAGVADGGRTLLLVTVDGRQPGFSEGVTTAELGAILERLGAQDAINLDGGGTTAMAIADPSRKGGVRLVNRPIHAGVPGKERVSASHLGVYAKRLGSP